MQARPASIGGCSGPMPRVIANKLFVVSGACVFAGRMLAIRAFNCFIYFIRALSEGIQYRGSSRFSFFLSIVISFYVGC